MVGWVRFFVIDGVLSMINLRGDFSIHNSSSEWGLPFLSYGPPSQIIAILVSPLTWLWTASSMKCLWFSSDLFLGSFGWASFFELWVPILRNALTLWDSDFAVERPDCWRRFFFPRSFPLSPCSPFLFWPSGVGSNLVLLRPHEEWLVKDSWSS